MSNGVTDPDGAGMDCNRRVGSHSVVQSIPCVQQELQVRRNAGRALLCVLPDLLVHVRLLHGATVSSAEGR